MRSGPGRRVTRGALRVRVASDAAGLRHDTAFRRRCPQRLTNASLAVILLEAPARSLPPSGWHVQPVSVSRCVPCPDNAACSLPPQDDPTGSQPLAAWGLGNAQLAQLLQPLGPQDARPLARRALGTGGTEPPRINGSSLADFLHAAKSELGAAVELGDRPDVEVFDAGGPAKSPVAGGTAASLLRGVVVPDDGYWHSSMFSGQVSVVGVVPAVMASALFVAGGSCRLRNGHSVHLHSAWPGCWSGSAGADPGVFQRPGVLR